MTYENRTLQQEGPSLKTNSKDETEFFKKGLFFTNMKAKPSREKLQRKNKRSEKLGDLGIGWFLEVIHFQSIDRKTARRHSSKRKVRENEKKRRRQKRGCFKTTEETGTIADKGTSRPGPEAPSQPPARQKGEGMRIYGQTMFHIRRRFP